MPHWVAKPSGKTPSGSLNSEMHSITVYLRFSGMNIVGAQILFYSKYLKLLNCKYFLFVLSFFLWNQDRLEVPASNVGSTLTLKSVGFVDDPIKFSVILFLSEKSVKMFSVINNKKWFWKPTPIQKAVGQFTLLDCFTTGLLQQAIL